MKPWMRNIFLPVLLMLLSAPAFAAAADTAAVNSTEKAEEEQVDVQGIIFGHINDSYEWHITDIGDKPVAIPLPVIIHSKTSGWHCFMSSKIAHGHEHDGFYISTSEKYDGKIVEKGPDGEEIRSSSRYKALGNAIALPCADYIMAGIYEALTGGDGKEENPHV